MERKGCLSSEHCVWRVWGVRTYGYRHSWDVWAKLLHACYIHPTHQVGALEDADEGGVDHREHAPEFLVRDGMVVGKHQVAPQDPARRPGVPSGLDAVGPPGAGERGQDAAGGGGEGGEEDGHGARDDAVALLAAHEEADEEEEGEADAAEEDAVPIIGGVARKWCLADVGRRVLLLVRVVVAVAPIRLRLGVVD